MDRAFIEDQVYLRFFRGCGRRLMGAVVPRCVSPNYGVISASARLHYKPVPATAMNRSLVIILDRPNFSYEFFGGECL